MGAGVGVMLIRDGKILLGKRNDDPVKADSLLQGEGTWTLPGGKLDFGESLEDAAVRETMEETSIHVEKGSLELISISNDISPKAHFVTLGFRAAKFSGVPKTMEPEEIVEWKWFPLESLPEPLFPPSRNIILNYKSGCVYQSKNRQVSPRVLSLEKA